MKTPLYFLFGLFLMMEAIEGALRVDAGKRAKDVMRRRREESFQRRRAVEEEDVNVSELLELTPGEAMQKAGDGKTRQGTSIEKLQETYHGVPVYDAMVTVRTDKNGRLSGDASGEFVQEIDKDLPSLQSRLTDDEVLEIAIKNEGDEYLRDSIGNEKVQEIVYLDKNDKAHLAKKVEYLIEAEEAMKRPTYIVDAMDGETLVSWDNLDTFTCGSKRWYKAFGGNEKLGKIKYGERPDCLEMRKEGDICFTENDYVKVVDMHQSRNNTIQEPASFKCKNGYEDEINGAYSPVIDALFYGTAVGKMYEDWYQTMALPEKIVLRIHFGAGWENAQWNGHNTTFGDGQSMFYPLSSSLDVVSHEVAHGVTEFGSAMMYFDEAGGMNEAFSDIMGEATQAYLRGSADMETGRHVMKVQPYLREFEVPERDNRSIGHADDMTPNTDPHFSSGVYRRVFYVVVEQKGMSVRNAAHVFLQANRLYWHHSVTFAEGACGTLKAAVDLGFSPTPFERAFADVGVTTCDYTDHIFSLANNITQPDITVSSEIRPLFRFQAAMWAEDVLIDARSGMGNVNIVVQNGTWSEDEDGLPIDVIAEGESHVVIHNAANLDLFIQVSSTSETPYDDVDVIAGWICQTDYNGPRRPFYCYYCYGDPNGRC